MDAPGVPRLPRQVREFGGFQLELMPGDPGVFAVQGEYLARQDLEHPGGEAGVRTVAVEGGEGPRHRVLEGVLDLLRFPEQPAGVRLQLALQRSQEGEEPFTGGCLQVAHGPCSNQTKRGAGRFITAGSAGFAPGTGEGSGGKGANTPAKAGHRPTLP